MDSGSIIPTMLINRAKGQAIYDTVVEKAGCSNTASTLEYLHSLDYKDFLKATNSLPSILSYTSLALSYLPRPDSIALPDNPKILLRASRYHAMPMIIGDQENKGTLFALFQPALTTTASLVKYLKEYYFSKATTAQETAFVNTYPEDISAGSPFRTGILNEILPGLKRCAALLGDMVFIMTQRLLLQTATEVNPDVPSWSYLSSYYYGLPILGTVHSSDIIQVMFGLLPNNAMRSIRTYYFNFLYNLDPNKGIQKYSTWPRWKDDKKLMWFETTYSNNILNDDFRSNAFNWLADYVEILQF